MSMIQKNWFAAFASVALACFLAGICFAQGRQQKSSGGTQIVEDIISADCIVKQNDPPSLIVTVTAIDPKGLPQNPRIVPGVYKSPPEDGIQDLFVLAVPAGPGQPAETKFTVKHVWDGFRKKAPWLKGVRVHCASGALLLLVQE
ncbi:hypothetical protein P12x_000270 [Tundrisphaera lichenicola]|uniref:hypothetical protein n=1 Tax=Tundrisphaera lichenicola TaxID=2029860 RepID=UPI003EBC8785